MLNVIDPKSVGKNGRDAYKVGAVSKWSDGRNAIKTPSGWAITNKAANVRNVGSKSANKTVGRSGSKPSIQVKPETKTIRRVVRKI